MTEREQIEALRGALALILEPMCELHRDYGIVSTTALVVSGDDAFERYHAARKVLQSIHAASPAPLPTTERRFKVLNTKETVPWSLVFPHERQAQANHDQTLERLNERGGLDWVELLAVVTDRPWRDVLSFTEEAARDAVLALVEVLPPTPLSAQLETKPELEQIERLKADQQDWRKGVALIASALGDSGDNLSCARLAEMALAMRARLEDLSPAPLSAQEPETNLELEQIEQRIWNLPSEQVEGTQYVNRTAVLLAIGAPMALAQARAWMDTSGATDADLRRTAKLASSGIVPDASPLSAQPTEQELAHPSQADIDMLEKVAWDANVEHVVIWYRDRLEQLRRRMRESDQAMKIERQRAVRSEAKLASLSAPEPEPTPADLKTALAKVLSPLAAPSPRETALRAALAKLLERYTALVNCGDCGSWNPEEEQEVIAARAALSSTEDR